MNSLLFFFPFYNRTPSIFYQLPRANAIWSLSLYTQCLCWFFKKDFPNNTLNCAVAQLPQTKTNNNILKKSVFKENPPKKAHSAVANDNCQLTIDRCLSARSQRWVMRAAANVLSAAYRQWHSRSTRVLTKVVTDMAADSGVKQLEVDYRWWGRWWRKVKK